MKKLLVTVFAVGMMTVLSVPAFAATPYVCPNGNTACVESGACVNNGQCLSKGSCGENTRKLDGTGPRHGGGHGGGHHGGRHGR